jgi:signal peptidase I
LTHTPTAKFFRVSTEETTEVVVVTAASVSQPAVAHHGHVHLVFPNLLDTFRSLLSIIVMALFVLTFVVQPFRIPSESMERTLLVGDFLLVNKTVYAPQVVKRVVAVPGDRIHLQDGVVCINGQKQSEPFAIFDRMYQDNFRDQFPARLYTDPGVDTHWWIQMRHDVQNGELVVPAGEYFVLGDNRNHSRDSRYWGFVPRTSVVGLPFLIYFSVHQPSATDANQLPDDKLGHEKSPLDKVMDFARWSRMFRVIH